MPSLAPLARLAATLALLGAAACGGGPLAPDAGARTLPTLDVALPDSVAEAYRRDAVTLAVRQHREGRSPAERPVEVPAALVDGFYRALAAVHASTGPARDTVVAVFRIHAFPEATQLLVGVDPAQPWTQGWARGETVTGNAAVDALVARYGLRVERYYPWVSGHAAVLGSARPLDVAALASRFAGLAGVRYAEPNGYMGDGDDIRARPVVGGWELDYSLGFGDCPAGCTGRRWWTFVVDPAGRVTYRGSR